MNDDNRDDRHDPAGKADARTRTLSEQVVEALADGRNKRVRKLLQRLHPAKIAALLERLEPAQRLALCQRQETLPALPARLWWIVLPACIAVLGAMATWQLSTALLRYAY